MNGICPNCKAPIRTYPDVVDDKFESVAMSAKTPWRHNCQLWRVCGEAVVTGEGAQ